MWAGMHTHKSQYVNMKMLWNKGVHKRENVRTKRRGNTSGQKCHAKGSRKETKTQ